jgi:integrase
VPESGQTYHYDEDTDGFGVRCSSGGRKAYFVQFRQRGSRRVQRKTLGSASVVSAQVAREKAIEIRARAELGEAVTPEKSLTFQEAYELHLNNHLAYRCDRYQELAESLWRLHVPKHLKHVDVTALRKRDLLVITDRLIKAGKVGRAEWALSYLKAMFNWLIHDREALIQNPLSRAKLPVKTRPRTRVLDTGEARLVWMAACRLPETLSLAARLFMITGCRRNEILELRTSEVQRGGLLVLPAERVKNRHEHRLQLPAQLRKDVLAYLKTVKGDRLFNNSDSRIKAALIKESGVTGWTPHDLRRTAAPMLASLGVAPHIIEHALNHRNSVAVNVGSRRSTQAPVRHRGLGSAPAARGPLSGPRFRLSACRAGGGIVERISCQGVVD